jgi:superfamily I DNA and/or RNA helicase
MALIARYPTARAIVAVGDPKQLQPVVMSDQKSNNLSGQLRLSTSARLMKLGHPFVLLKEQHRMVEGTGELVSDLAYGGQIMNGAGTSIQDRQVSGLMQAFLNNKFGLPAAASPRLLFDVERGTMTPVATSKVNLQNAGFVIQLIRQLRADVSDRLEICILTPYAAQAELYRSCIRIMGWDESRIEARTVDGYQGSERSIVILDLVFVSRIGFMNDLHRLTVALSRHRDCLLIVGHVKSIASARPRSAKKLTMMLTHFQRTQQVYAVKTENLGKDPVLLAAAGSTDLARGSRDPMLCRRCKELGHKQIDCPLNTPEPTTDSESEGVSKSDKEGGLDEQGDTDKQGNTTFDPGWGPAPETQGDTDKQGSTTFDPGWGPAPETQPDGKSSQARSNMIQSLIERHQNRWPTPICKPVLRLPGKSQR